MRGATGPVTAAATGGSFRRHPRVLVQPLLNLLPPWIQGAGSAAVGGWEGEWDLYLRLGGQRQDAAGVQAARPTQPANFTANFLCSGWVFCGYF